MPIVEESNIDWAREIDEKDNHTQVESKVENGFRKEIQNKVEDGKLIRVTNIFKVDKVRLPRAVAERKNLKKFGEAERDPPGVNAATTLIGEEVKMVFLANKEEAMRDAAEPPAALVPKIQCRYCKGDHWTTKCQLKEYYEKLESGKSDVTDGGARRPGDNTLGSSSTGGAYRPPGMRGDGATSSSGGRKFDTGRGGPRGDEYTIRVTNLPEEATENDIMELFKPFGVVKRVFLATDKVTKQSRGFAFVNFQNKDDAQRAIYGVNDYGYNHLILKVEWAKPSKDS